MDCSGDASNSSGPDVIFIEASQGAFNAIPTSNVKEESCESLEENLTVGGSLFETPAFCKLIFYVTVGLITKGHSLKRNVHPFLTINSQE